MPQPSDTYDAVVVGAGPNGLAAAITLARAGRAVLLLEAELTVGGGTRSAELTLPGFLHDICSAVHPLGVGSAFFQSLSLREHGLEWIHPPAPLAHPFDDGTAATLERSVGATSATLGGDAAAYWRLMSSIVRDWEKIAYTTHGPLRLSPHLLALARFGLRAIWPARGLAEVWFRGERARGLFAGLSLSGATLREDSDWNMDLYGKKITNREIIMKGNVAIPKGAQGLITELNRYSSRK